MEKRFICREETRASERWNENKKDRSVSKFVVSSAAGLSTPGSMPAGSFLN